MPPELTIDAKVEKWEELAHRYLKDAGYAPNSNQLGVAIAGMHRFAKSKRQYWLVPSGMGKSRIIAAFATIIAKAYNKKITGIYIAFSE